MAMSSFEVSEGSRIAGDGESEVLMPSDIERFLEGKGAAVPQSPTRSSPALLLSLGSSLGLHCNRSSEN